MNSNKKDNTGYDLKHLFVGSEGTLGIITKIAMSCPRAPLTRRAAFVVCETFLDVLTVLDTAMSELGETLAAFEFMDHAVICAVAEQKALPISLTESDVVKDRFYILVESQGSHIEHDDAKMEMFLEKCTISRTISDGILTQDLKQVHDL